MLKQFTEILVSCNELTISYAECVENMFFSTVKQIPNQFYKMEHLVSKFIFGFNYKI